MAMLAACAGAVLVGTILWEVFDDLFRPGGSGALSDWIGRRLFNLSRRSRRTLTLAGPLTIVIVIGVWVAGLILGFALMYIGSFPGSFETSTGRAPSAIAPFRSALYFSFETLITLGYGDVVPRTFSMRLLSTAEALVGFGILTASVSSIVLLYPALSRLRLLARSVAHVVAAEQETGTRVSATGSDVLLCGLARDVTHTRIDLVHFPMVYYFAAFDQDGSLARWTRQLARIAAESAAGDRPPHVRIAAVALDHALTDLADLLANRFVDAPREDREQVFAAFGADHAVEIA